MSIMNIKRLKPVKYAMIIIFVVTHLMIAGLALRMMFIPKLQPWHTFVPAEMTVAELEKATWDDYVAREKKLFDDVYREVVQKTPQTEKTAINKYFEGSKVYPPALKKDWNHSFLLTPDNPKGVVVLLHGLTDSPYSVRNIAFLYFQRGFVAMGIRTPGHGTVPGGLAKCSWNEWVAATRLAAREARKLSPEGTPLHMVGFSQGGALAVKYALDALEDNSLPRPDRLVLISPMIGITRLSRLAEFVALPSVLPLFKQAAWLSISPEFNPFKYNSFPVNAVKQARLLITGKRRQIARLYETGKLKEMPPIITFQSIVDYTVSTPALINDLYSYLPYNGSELVLFDINRGTVLTPLIRPIFTDLVSNMLPDLPQRYTLTIIGNAADGDSRAVERRALPGETRFTERELGLIYPTGVFSLSHISLPFPETDPLYGSAPDPQEKDAYGLNLGLVSNAQGERGILEINMNLFFRISSNPLFPYFVNRMDEIISGSPPPPTPVGKPDAVKSTKCKMTPKQYDDLLKESGYNEGQF